MNDLFKDDEPDVELDDIDCACTEDGIDSDWEWLPDQHVWICNGCGEVQ